MNNLDYAIIGNCKSSALISKTGSIDWLCLPDFNSSSVFAKLLDQKKGGSFEIIVDESYNIKQQYIRTTNIVSTYFTNGNDAFELIDFMPRFNTGNGSYYNPPDIIRYFRYVSGKPCFKLKYDPRLRYAKYEIIIKDEEDYIKSYTTNGDYDSIYLYTDFKHSDILSQKEIHLTNDAFALLSYNQKILNQSIDKQYLDLQKTKTYWLNWSNDIPGFTSYNEEIIRSALVLKLLSYDRTGAVLAAATTSLPETIGEERNWDYRFCWIRDASMVIKILANLGHLRTTRRFINFIIDIIPDKDEKIQIMYGINQEKKLTEEVLSHLSGYENSKPVRIGNAAYQQKQNDIYGILMDVIYQQFTIFTISLENSETLWTIVRSIVRIVANNWQEPDKGIWEIRTDEKHFTFSKVLCWVAIDRAVKIAKIIRKEKYIGEWEDLAQTIHEDILKHAWNAELEAFTQSYGSSDMDASILLMQPYGFIKAKDEMYVKTVKAIEKELCVDGLMYRYKNKDDFGIPNSSFTICTFWLIDALNAIGERKKAKEMFTRLLSYSNHVGLFSEDIDFKTKRLLGNFPQAYSHLALIETAINLAKGKITEDEKIKEAIQ